MGDDEMTPQGDDPPVGDSFYASDDGTPRPTGKATQGFWQRLLHGVPGKNRFAEVARSIPRGLANAGNAIGQFGAEALASGADALGIGGSEKEQDARKEKAKDFKFVSEDEMDMTYGARSDDPLAQISETLTQGVATGILLRGAGVRNLAANFALTDAIGFDPYQASVSELLRDHGDKLPVPVVNRLVKEAGKLGSVNADDNFAIARLKRVAEGWLVGKAVDALWWGAKKAVTSSRRAAGKATAEDAAHEAAADQAITELADNTAKSDASVVAKANEDGTFRIETNPDSPTELALVTPPEPPVKPAGEPNVTADAASEPIVAPGESFGAPVRPEGRPSSAAEAFTNDVQGIMDEVGSESALGGKGKLRFSLGGDVAKIETVESLVDEPGIGSQLMKHVTEAADKNGITLTLQAVPFGPKARGSAELRNFYRKFGFERVKDGDAQMVRTAGAKSGEFREPFAEKIEGPVFNDRAEAEAQASTMSEVRDAQARAADPVADLDLDEHFATAERIAAAGTKRDARALLSNEHFNFNYVGGTDAVRAQMAALSERYRAAFTEAQKRGTSVETTIALAEDVARGFGVRDAKAYVSRMAAERQYGHVDILIANRLYEQMGDKLADIGARRAARPHDPALMAEARATLDLWTEIGPEVAGLNSDLGRSLNILKERAGARSVKFSDDIDVIRDATTFTDEALADAAKAAKRLKAEPEAAVADLEDAVSRTLKSLESAQEVEAQLFGIREPRTAKPKPKGARENWNTKDTRVTWPYSAKETAGADDFVLARQRAKAQRILEKLNPKPKVANPESNIAEVMRDGNARTRSRDVMEAADAQRQNPLTATDAQVKAADAVPDEGANPIEELSRWLEDAQKEVGRVRDRVESNTAKRDLARRKKEGTAFDANARQSDTPVDDAVRQGTEAERREREFKRTHDVLNEPPAPKREKNGQRLPKEPTLRFSASMSDEEVDATLRLFQRAGGKLKNAHAVTRALTEATGLTAKGPFPKFTNALSTGFINALISGVRTGETILSSGFLLNNFEAGMKVLAGAGSLNPKLAREGADQWMGLYKYAGAAMRGAGAAFREGRSVIDPTPSMYATGGVLTNAVSIPGRAAGALDEFTRQSAYRGIEYAKALRAAREAGLTGEAAIRRAESDVDASVDAVTKMGLNEKTLKEAGVPTLSDPLGTDTFIGKIAATLAEYPATRLIVPFIRPGVNSFRYMVKSTPAINLAYKEVRDAYAKALKGEGSEELAVITARSATAGAAMFWAYSNVVGDRITGNGPTDPGLRQSWLDHHEPYSVKINGEWVAYRRFEPLASWLGLAADASFIMNETDDEEDGANLAGAVFASTMSNIFNKSWAVGLSGFVQAVDDQDMSSFDDWAGTLASGFIPQAIQQFNTDPVYREAQGFTDRIKQKTPGLSSTLPARYEFTGEPMMRQKPLWNNLVMVRRKDASPSLLEDTMLEHGIELSPFKAKQFGGQLDLNDKRWAIGGKTPYDRFMEILRTGIDGEPPLRKALENRILDPAFAEADDGTSDFPGGYKGQLLADVKSTYEKVALAMVLQEYESTGLTSAYFGAKQLRTTAKLTGEKGVADLRREFGIPEPK